MLRTDTRSNAKLHHYALHGKLLHKVHAVPRRTTQEHTVPRCSTEVHTLQVVCYVPKYGTTRNYTITHCTARYCTQYKRYHVGLLRYIRYHGTNGVLLRTHTQLNAKLHHYALHGEVLHKVHAIPRRTTEVHTVPRCNTEVHTVQTVCYVPKHSTTRNYTIAHCTTGYCTKYTRYHVGLLRYIRYHDVVPRYIRYERCVKFRRGIRQGHFCCDLVNTGEKCSPCLIVQSMSLVKTLSAQQTLKQVTTKVTLSYTTAEMPFSTILQLYQGGADFNNITVISRRSLTQFSTILQLYHGGVYRRFLQNYIYTTAKFNSVFNIITVTSRRSLSPFLTI